jgi:hypothetical protein
MLAEVFFKKIRSIFFLAVIKMNVLLKRYTNVCHWSTKQGGRNWEIVTGLTVVSMHSVPIIDPVARSIAKPPNTWYVKNRWCII